MMNSEMEISAPRSLRLGDLAPDFEARSTRGPLKLSDYRGQWLLFFSHPADFTPVCTTEFVEIARRAKQFDRLGCALVGLSVDSLYAHLAWIRAIQQRFDVAITFPIIEDPSMAVGRAFGMVDENSIDSKAMRSNYVIDPEGIIRATSCYPHNVGRSVDEMLRLVAALQAADDGQSMTPAGWMPGEETLAMPPATLEEIGEGDDWFCRPSGSA